MFWPFVFSVLASQDVLMKRILNAYYGSIHYRFIYDNILYAAIGFGILIQLLFLRQKTNNSKDQNGKLLHVPFLICSVACTLPCLVAARLNDLDPQLACLALLVFSVGIPLCMTITVFVSSPIKDFIPKALGVAAYVALKDHFLPNLNSTVLLFIHFAGLSLAKILSTPSEMLQIVKPAAGPKDAKKKNTNKANSNPHFEYKSSKSLEYWTRFLVMCCLFHLIFVPTFSRKNEFKNHIVIAREDSITGTVSVVDVKNQYGKLRVLKCDHSLLGGVFTGHGGQSIFSIFYFQEFLKYVERPEAKKEGMQALKIGLGIGVSANGLMNSGIHIDIVEIDPAVYNFALEFFDLQDKHTIHFADGAKYLEETAEERQYDYILHDVFSGGYVPETLFSVEVLNRTSQLLKPDGVLGLNYVGLIDSEATVMVASTLKKVFPYVRVFTEIPPNEVKPESLINFVFFASQKEMKFNLPSESEVLEKQGQVYAQMVNRFADCEWKNQNIYNGSFIYRHNNTLNAKQRVSGGLHWKVMRQILDLDFWINY